MAVTPSVAVLKAGVWLLLTDLEAVFVFVADLFAHHLGADLLLFFAIFVFLHLASIPAPERFALSWTCKGAFSIGVT
jgi:hypothetical protein